jgi:rod shape-determining protein MreC
MQQLLAFLYKYRVFGYFLFLQLLCFWLLTRYNRYYNASFFNSSNYLAAQIQSSRNQFQNYLSLVEVNKELSNENARLRRQLAKQLRERSSFDSTRQFEYITSDIVSSDFQRSENYLTLNKGSNDGISPGMGVLSPNGVVGIVKSTSRRFSTVTSLLHQDLMVSSVLASSETLCTTQWDAVDPLTSAVKYIPRHISVRKGDSVLTSGFNAIFPEGLLIGTIEDFKLSDESPFYEAEIKLASDFTSLHIVYVIKNRYKDELDSLQLLNDSY